MKSRILELIHEQHSPLFRIMSIHNDNEPPARKKFDNNISASHIGNGYIISVAHNLRIEAGLINSISETDFQNNIINNCNPSEKLLFNKCYQLDPQTNKRYINITDNDDVPKLIEAFKRINYDTRWITLYSNGICKPFLVVQFKNNKFYNDSAVTALFNPNHTFPEPALNIHTFIIELELIKAYWAEDISIYKISNHIDQKIVEKIPTASISLELADIGSSLYCLQGSPSGDNLGRMVNESRVEGMLDQHSPYADSIGGNYHLEGHRYLLKGYFRFGSSGAPCLIYNTENNDFMINALQSEASPIQLTINNNRNGNFQYINAIATPLQIIKNDLNKIINNFT